MWPDKNGYFGAYGGKFIPEILVPAIIHPEEVLADNFKHLVTGKKDLPDPEIVDRMRALLCDRDE